MEEKSSLFLCAAQDLYAQSDPAVPRPGKDPDEAGVDGRIYHVLSVRVVVKVALEHLKQAEQETFSFTTQAEGNIYCAKPTALNLKNKQKSLKSLRSDNQSTLRKFTHEWFATSDF